MSMIENTDELIERLRDADASGSHWASEAADAIERLTAEVEALRADKDRIDWLTQHGVTIYTRSGAAIYALHGHMTIRSAIDAARKA